MGALKLTYQNPESLNLKVVYRNPGLSKTEPGRNGTPDFLGLDCYPFGSIMPGRSYSSNSYRFGFQGQEKDDEITGVTGSHLSFKYRIHDARIGRFLSVDPLASKYPHNSPYAFAENRVIDGIELEGLEWKETKDKEGNVTGATWEGYDTKYKWAEGASAENGDMPIGSYQVPKPGTVGNVTVDDGTGNINVFATDNYEPKTFSVSYDANLKEFMPTLLKHEGGFVDNPNDPGGATNMGITYNTFKKYAKNTLGVEPSLGNLKNLSKTQALMIYQVGYWKPSKAGNVSDKQLSFLYFDTYVNGGGHTVLSSSLEGWGKSGVSGLNTVLKTVNASDIYYIYKEERICRYDRLIENNPKLATFRNGWVNRVNSFNYEK